MLIQISGHIRRDMIQNEENLLKIRTIPIDEKISESHLRQFGHVQRRALNLNAQVRKSDLIQVERMNQSRVKPKIKQIKVVKKIHVI